MRPVVNGTTANAGGIEAGFRGHQGHALRHGFCRRCMFRVRNGGNRLLLISALAIAIVVLHLLGAAGECIRLLRGDAGWFDGAADATPV